MTQQSVAEPAGVGSRWWRDAVIYQIYLRSFADGDGDGVGDLLGVRSRLRYLSWLGVDALWLTPFSPSPMADGGHGASGAPGVAGHRAADPAFGTLGDTESLIIDAHRHGLKVLLDIVPHHASAAHPWFTQAVAAPPGSPERDRYVLRPGRGDLTPDDREPTSGGPAWSRLPDGEWHLRRAAPEQADRDRQDPGVHGEVEDTMRFWLDRGVDGFRVGVGVATAWAPDAERFSRSVPPGELHQAFNLPYLRAGWSAAGLRKVIDDSL